MFDAVDKVGASTTLKDAVLEVSASISEAEVADTSGFSAAQSM
jgi:hypothetical protein